MSDKITGKTVLGAITDFIILVLVVGGAGLGGYFVGINQKLAPIQLVPPGTAGAKTLKELGIDPGKADAANTSAASKPQPATPVESGAKAPTAKAEGKADDQKPQESTAQSEPKKQEKTKYWLISSGADYCGYSITVQVNGTPVDAFFGPDKIIDVTKLVHSGDNAVKFEAKALGEQYNKHTGDPGYSVTVKLVKGAHVQDNYAAKDVLMSYSRTAADTEDYNETKHFKGE